MAKISASATCSRRLMISRCRPAFSDWRTAISWRRAAISLGEVTSSRTAAKRTEIQRWAATNGRRAKFSTGLSRPAWLSRNSPARRRSSVTASSVRERFLVMRVGGQVVRRRAPSGRGPLQSDEVVAVLVEILEDLSRSSCDTGHRIFGLPNSHAKLLGQAFRQTLELGAAAGKADAGLHQIGDQFGGHLVDSVFDRVDDNLDRPREGLTDLNRGDLHGLGQTAHQVSPPHDRRLLLLQGVGRAERDLGFLRHALADQQTVL